MVSLRQGMTMGMPFTEHRDVPVLAVGPASGRPAWQQAAGMIGTAIGSWILPACDLLPFIREIGALQDAPADAVQHAVTSRLEATS